MNPLLRRILLITLFTIVVFAFGYVIYIVFFKPTALPGSTNQPGLTNGLITPGDGNVNRQPASNVNGLPNINQPAVTGTPSNVANGGATIVQQVVPTSSLGFTTNGNHTGFQYYDKNTGQFYLLSEDGLTKTLLTDATYRGVDQIVWAPSGTQAILQFPDGSKILYDFSKKKQTTLPKELDDFTFSPQSDQIASKYLNADNKDDQWLVVSKPDGSQSSSVEHLGENADKVATSWAPNNQVVATYEKSVSADRSEIIFLGAKGENLPSAEVAGRGFTPNWAADGRRLIFSTYSAGNDDNPHLFLMNAGAGNLGTGIIDLGLNTTADKCAFGSNGFSVYCAVPYYLNPGSGPQPELSAGIPDNIYKIDLLNGSANIIARPIDGNLNQRFSAQDLKLSSQEDALYFTDATTGTVQKIQLR